MAFGTTITATVTPTLGLWVSYEASTAAGLVHYDITCASTGHTLTPVVSTGTKVYIGQLRASQVYTVTVTADATVDQVATTTVNTAPANIPFSWEQILRQRLADIVTTAAITRSGAALYVVADNYGQPRVMNDADLIGKRTPLLEIGIPRLLSSRQQSTIMRTNVYKVEILVADTRTDPEAAATYCQGVAAQIRAAIDATTCLTLFGIHDKSWTWSYSDPKEHNNWISIGMILNIPVQEYIGVMPYAT